MYHTARKRESHNHIVLLQWRCPIFSLRAILSNHALDSRPFFFFFNCSRALRYYLFSFSYIFNISFSTSATPSAFNHVWDSLNKTTTTTSSFTHMFPLANSLFILLYCQNSWMKKSLSALAFHFFLYSLQSGLLPHSWPKSVSVHFQNNLSLLI